MKILFLYTELAGYFVSCLKVLSLQVDHIHIVRWPVHKEAPFEFEFPENVSIYERQDYSNKTLTELARLINPEMIICSGWIDKGYMSVCKAFKGKIPTVMSMDNHWLGSAKQHLMTFLAPFTLHPCFSHAWVPGEPQRQYALRLNFSQNKIQTGFYSADTEYFEAVADKIRLDKQESIPHRFLYVGRYVESKGIATLWNAFVDAQEACESDWELWCLGTGDLFDGRRIHPRIKHFGFVQPADLEGYLAQTSVFILPSFFEPWGVVVHEMAASGKALICSDRVGAANLFLKEGINGYSFQAGNEVQLKDLLLNIMLQPDEAIIKMGEQSRIFSHQITPKIWVEKLMSFTT